MTDETRRALGDLAASERAAWAALEASFAAVQDALQADAPTERVVELLLAVDTARQQWAAASRAKQEFADDAVLRLTIALNTRTPSGRARR